MKREKYILITLFFVSIIFLLNISAQAEEIPKQATLYYDNSVTNWSSVYIYIWGPNEHFLPWGDKSLKMNIENNICSYTLSLDDRDSYTNIIFWDGGSQQTSDLVYAGEQQIFRGMSKSTDYSTTKWAGSWFFKDDGRLLSQKLKLSAISKEWYTKSSYDTLSLTVSEIPSSYSDAYLLISDGTSQYEKDYNKLTNAYNNLEYSTSMLTTKLTELEAKNMTGYAYASVLAFRNEASEVKAFINENIFTEETLKNNYAKLEDSVRLLVIETENGANTAVEALKNEINKINDLLSSYNNTNTEETQNYEELIKLLKEIEASYKELTSKNSNLSGNIEKLLNEVSDKNALPEALAQLNEEFKKISLLLESDTIKVDDLISGYEKMEIGYQNADKYSYQPTVNNPYVTEKPTAIPIIGTTSVNDNKFIYFNFIVNIVQTILIGLIAFLMIKKKYM